MKTLNIKTINNEKYITINFNGLDEFENNEIFVDPNYMYVCAYNGTKIKLFSYNKEIDISNIVTDEILDNFKILFNKTISINENVYFVFYCKNNEESIIFYISINIINDNIEYKIKKIDNNKVLEEKNINIFLNYDDILIYRKIYYVNNERKINIIDILNDNEYIFDFTNKIDNADFDNLSLPIPCKKYNNDIEKYINEIDYDFKNFPIFIYNKKIDEENMSYLLKIDLTTNEITENKIFKNNYIPDNSENIKIFLNDNYVFCYYTNNDLKYLLKIANKETKIQNMDNEFIINNKSNTDTFVEIKSNAPSYDGLNENKFFSKETDEGKSFIKTNENEEINVLNNDKNKLFMNFEKVITDKEENENLIKEQINITDEIMQEISNEIYGGIIFKNKNNIVISSKTNKNIPISVENINTKSEQKDIKNFRYIHTNSCALPPSKNTKYIFPFIDIINNNFSSFSFNKDEIFTIQNIFLNYINFYRYKKDKNENLFTNILNNENNEISKLLLYSNIKSSLGQKELNNTIDNAQHMKIINENIEDISKNDIIDTDLELLSNDINKKSIFEYFNEYGEYKFKN